MPVSLVQDGPREDHHVEDDADEVEGGEGGHQPQKALLEVEGGGEDHPQCHHVTCTSLEFVRIFQLWKTYVLNICMNEKLSYYDRTRKFYI